MKIAIGSDEKTHLTDHVVALVEAAGHEVSLFGPLRDEAQDWPNVAREVAETVANGAADEGILFCWTGTGVSVAANNVPGTRGARLWNKANVLCLSLRRTSDVKAKEMLETWFGTAYAPNEVDDRCLRQVDALEAAYRVKE